MIRGYAVADVRAAEDRVRSGLPDGELMQRAARGLAEVVAVRAGQHGGGAGQHGGAGQRGAAPASVVVLAGPGDNGGDALWAASFLDGPSVTVVGIAARLHPEGLSAARAAGVRVVEVPPDAEELPPPAREALAAADVVVDGLLGIGGRPGLRGAMAAAVDAVPDTAYVISVDLPSGTDPAGQEQPGASGAAVFADETVTFGMGKPVHLLPATEAAVGRLTVVDIGVEMEVPPAVERLEHDDVRRLWPVPGPQDHKYSRGVVGVVAGSEAYPGAAVLCCTAAVEAGAGMVRYVGPPRPTDLVLAACPEVVPGTGRMQAAVVGPGVEPHGADRPGHQDHQAATVRELLAEHLPLVVDAGALELLASWVAAGHRRSAATLLTPHAGELARLLTTLGHSEVTREEVQGAPVAHARRAAALTGCTVLLKGSTTLVVDPDPAVPVRAQADAPPWLATAGAGDVLAGLAGVLLAAGLAPLDAGSLAALVHGVAAERANPGGPVRALAVARSLPATVARLLSR